MTLLPTKVDAFKDRGSSFLSRSTPTFMVEVIFLNIGHTFLWLVHFFIFFAEIPFYWSHQLFPFLKIPITLILFTFLSSGPLFYQKPTPYFIKIKIPVNKITLPKIKLKKNISFKTSKPHTTFHPTPNPFTLQQTL